VVTVSAFTKDGRPRAWLRLLAFYGAFILILAAVGAGALFILPRLGVTPFRSALRLSPTRVPIFATAAAGEFIVLLGLTAVARRRLDRKSPLASLGFQPSRAPRGLGLGFLGGLTLAAVVTGAIWFLGGVDIRAVPAGVFHLFPWLIILLALGAAGAAEELLFRGYPTRVLDEAWGRAPAVLLPSVAFAVLHGLNPSVTPLALANVFLAGVLLAILYLGTGSLWLAVGSHWGWNFGLGGVFGCGVSGLGWPASLWQAAPAGPAWLSGGAFGPEASAVFTAFAVALVATLLLLTPLGARKDAPAGGASS